MEERRDYYQVFWDGCPGIVHEKIEHAIEDISESLKAEVEAGDLGEETGAYKIKIIQLTPDEFAALPEFDGY